MLEEVKELFEIYLSPIKEDIHDLKKGQSELIEIAKIQVRHTIEIEDIKKDVEECFGCVKKIKEKKNDRLWNIITIGIAGIVGGLLSKIFN